MAARNSSKFLKIPQNSSISDWNGPLKKTARNDPMNREVLGWPELQFLEAMKKNVNVQIANV